MYPKAGKPSRRTIEKPILPSLRHSHCGTDSIVDPSPFVAHIGSPIPCRKTRRRPSVACAQDRDMCPSHLFVHHYSSNVTRPTQPHQLRYNTLLSSQFLCVVHTYPLPTPVLLSSLLTFLPVVTLCTTSVSVLVSVYSLTLCTCCLILTPRLRTHTYDPHIRTYVRLFSTGKGHTSRHMYLKLGLSNHLFSSKCL